jgi:hypothetical protein
MVLRSTRSPLRLLQMLRLWYPPYTEDREGVGTFKVIFHKFHLSEIELWPFNSWNCMASAESGKTWLSCADS